MVGTQTALNDNPGLTVRNAEGTNPVRILIDFDLKVPQHFKIYNDEAKTLVLNSIKEGTENNIQFIKISKENFLPELMEALYKEQIQSVIIEGGRFTLQQFIDSGLWDEAIVIKNDSLVLENGTKAPVFNHMPIKTEAYRDNLISFLILNNLNPTMEVIKHKTGAENFKMLTVLLLNLHNQLQTS